LIFQQVGSSRQKNGWWWHDKNSVNAKNAGGSMPTKSAAYSGS